MSAAIERILGGQQALAQALDEGSAAQIEAAAATLAQAVQAVQSSGGWLTTPELRDLLKRALLAGEATRVRTRYLAEHGRARLDRIHALKGRAQVGYGRNGLYRAA